jgi:hypothetical protein
MTLINMSSKNCSAHTVCQYLSEKNIWVHQGVGLLEDIKYTVLKADTKVSFTGTTSVDDAFTEPQLSNCYKTKPRGVIWFSKGSWLFDRYHDSRCDCTCKKDDHFTWCSSDCASKCSTHIDYLNGSNVLAIKKPTNILHIKTLVELKEFVANFAPQKVTPLTFRKKEYMKRIKDDRSRDQNLEFNHFIRTFEINESKAKKVLCVLVDEYITCHVISEVSLSLMKPLERMKKSFPECKKLDFGRYDFTNPLATFSVCLERVLYSRIYDILEKMPDEFEIDPWCIDWVKIKKAGWYGIAFHFCKVTEIGATLFDFPWHSGFDVESLCIWDLRAFENTVHPVTIKK